MSFKASKSYSVRTRQSRHNMENANQPVYLVPKKDKAGRPASKEGEAPTQEGNPRDMPIRTRQPLVNWKRLPWGPDMLSRRSMSDHVALADKAANGITASQELMDRPRKPFSTAFKSSTVNSGQFPVKEKQSKSRDVPKADHHPISNKQTNDVSNTGQWKATKSSGTTPDMDMIVKEEDGGNKTEKLKSKLEDQEAKRDEYYKTKDRMEREMEVVIENTEREHDRLMNLRAVKRKMEADRDKLMANVYATTMEAKNFEISLVMEATRYEELLETFDALKTTIEDRKATCPASFSLLLHLQERLKINLDDSLKPQDFRNTVKISPSSAHAISTYIDVDDSDKWSDSSPVMSPSDLFKSYQEPTPARTQQLAKSAFAKANVKDHIRNMECNNARQKRKSSKYQRVRNFFRNLFIKNKTRPNN